MKPIDETATLWPARMYTVDDGLFQFVPLEHFECVSFAIVALMYPRYQKPFGPYPSFRASICLAWRYIINILAIQKIQGIFGGVTYGTVLVEEHVP